MHCSAEDMCACGSARMSVCLICTHHKSGVHNGVDARLVSKCDPHCRVTLLGNILLRSIVVSVLIRLINGYSVTDGT